jgi:hypothetical protein
LLCFITDDYSLITQERPSAFVDTMFLYHVFFVDPRRIALDFLF